MKYEAVLHFARSIVAREKFVSEGIHVIDHPYAILDEQKLEDSYMECCTHLFKLLLETNIEENTKFASEDRHMSTYSTGDESMRAKKEFLFDKGEIAVKTGSIYCKQKDFAQALEFYASAFVSLERKFGSDHFSLGDLYYKKGYVHQLVKDDCTALHCYLESIQILRKAERHDTLLFAEILHNLGDLYYKEKKYDEALQAYKDAFPIRKKQLGDLNVDTAKTLHQIGVITFEGKGDLYASFQCISTALRIRKKLLDYQNEDLADSLHFLGRIHHIREEIELANSCFVEELKMLKQTNSKAEEQKKNQKVADCLYCNGEVYFSLRQLENAKETFEDALKLYRDVFGSKHIAIIRTMNNLGNILHEMRDYNKAIDCFHDVQNLASSFLEQNNVELAFTSYHLGLVHNKLDQNDDAMENYMKSLSIYKHHYGKENAFVVDLMNNMGMIFFDAKYYEKALKCFGQALKSCLKVLGPNHERTGELSKKMGEVMAKMGNFEAALDHYHDAASVLEINLNKNQLLRTELHEVFTAIAHITREKIGSENEEMANVMSHIGNLHANTRDYDAAMKCFTEAFRIHKVILGEDDIALATDLQKCV